MAASRFCSCFAMSSSNPGRVVCPFFFFLVGTDTIYQTPRMGLTFDFNLELIINRRLNEMEEQEQQQ